MPPRPEFPEALREAMIDAEIIAMFATLQAQDRERARRILIYLLTCVGDADQLKESSDG